MYPPPLDADTAWLVLIRHGATAINLEDPPRLQGREPDTPLCSQGRWQARQTALALRSWPVAGVYTSPLLRARQTAQEIAHLHCLEPMVEPDLVECDLGHWAGLTWPEVMQRDPEHYKRFIQAPDVYGYRGGENLRQVVQRVEPVIARLGQANMGKLIVVVAHNIVLRAYFCHLLGMPPAQWRKLTQENCCINLLRWRAEKPKLVTLNALFHLWDGVPDKADEASAGCGPPRGPDLGEK